MSLEKGLESKLERLPRDEKGPRRKLISGLAQFVVSVDSSERLGKLAEALESLPKVGEEGAPGRWSMRELGCAPWSGCFRTERG